MSLEDVFNYLKDRPTLGDVSVIRRGRGKGDYICNKCGAITELKYQVGGFSCPNCGSVGTNVWCRPIVKEKEEK